MIICIFMVEMVILSILNREKMSDKEFLQPKRFI